MHQHVWHCKTLDTAPPGLKNERVNKEVMSTEVAPHVMKEEPPAPAVQALASAPQIQHFEPFKMLPMVA